MEEVCQRTVPQNELSQWFYRRILSALKTNNSNINCSVLTIGKKGKNSRLSKRIKQYIGTKSQ